KEYRSVPIQEGLNVLNALLDELRFTTKSTPTFVPVAKVCENPTAYAPPNVLKAGAPVSCDVAGDVFRVTVACKCRVGSNGRYKVSTRYSEERGVNRFTPTSRLF